MKVLFVDHPEADFHSSLIYQGLCEDLGPENVVDWPDKPTFHGESYRGWVPCLPPGIEGVSDPFPWQTPQPRPEPFDPDELSSFDLVILASPRPFNTNALAAMPRAAIRRLVMLDGEDYTAIRWDYVDRFRPDVYFKLSWSARPFEVYPRSKHPVKLLPSSLAAISLPPAREKTIDVVFLGGGNWRPGRREGQEAPPLGKPALDARLASEFKSYRGGNVSSREYMNVLSSARIAVCVGGHGAEPLRTFEILSCPGTLLLREREIEGIALVEGRDCAMFSGHEECVAKIRSMLANEKLRARVAAEGNAFLRANFTARVVARRILENSLA